MRARFALFVSLFLLATPAWATCANQYYRGAAPRLAQSAARDVRELCYDDFAVGHSSVTLTPLWSAEHITASEVDAARSIGRHDDFHPDDNLPFDRRAELSDYRRSGYDRGHMAPSGDMPTPEAQYQSFTLANVVPQVRSFNSGLWQRIEIAVRNLAVREGELFVVTGPVFSGGADTVPSGRVRVPQSLFKAVYDPARGQAGAYVADNAAGGRYRVISIAELQALIGADVFPSLPAAIKARAMDLPRPERREPQAPSETVARNREPTLGRILTAYSR